MYTTSIWHKAAVFVYTSIYYVYGGVCVCVCVYKLNGSLIRTRDNYARAAARFVQRANNGRRR